MATKPTVKPKWADDDVFDPGSGTDNVAEPSEAKKLRGWDDAEIPPRQWWNWLQRIIYRWIDWLDGTTIPLASDVGTANEQKADGTGHTHALNGASQAEAEAGTDNEKVMTPLRVAQAITEQTSPLSISDYTPTKISYFATGGIQYPSLSVSFQIPENTRQSIGPTGSGADYIWSELDFLPDDASILVFNASLRCGNPTTAGQMAIQLRLFPFGESGSFSESDIALLESISDGTSGNDAASNYKVHVKLDNDNRFTIEWDELGTASFTPTISMTIAEIHI